MWAWAGAIGILPFFAYDACSYPSAGRSSLVHVLRWNQEMLSGKSHLELYEESLDRCLEHGEFIPKFYEVFMSKSEEIRIKFLHTDFEHQTKMLAKSLKLIASASHGEQAGLQELHERAHSHDRYHLNVNSEHYRHWRESILAVAAEFDFEWNDEIKEAWNTILGFAISYMVRRY